MLLENLESEMAIVPRRLLRARLTGQYSINHSEEVRVNLTEGNQLRTSEFFTEVFEDLLARDDLCALELRRPKLNSVLLRAGAPVKQKAKASRHRLLKEEVLLDKSKQTQNVEPRECPVAEL